jgi:DNA helicase IV
MPENTKQSLRPELAAVVADEEALLDRVRAALEDARRPAGPAGLRSAEALEALREEAGEARAEDLPAVLHEMTVRHALAERRPSTALPDGASPYLAHLRVEEGEGPRDFLLGHVTFLDPAADVRIVDWRVAPVARIFYGYREGDEYSEEFPGRTAEGVVLARRIVVIEDGELTRIVGGDFVVERGPEGWFEPSRLAMAGGTGTAARPGVLGVGARHGVDVTAMLDAEQYAAVTAPPDEPLLVLGSAGSGKTTVALHRLARIAALDGHPLADMQVVVPEEGLARLSRRLLAPLGAGAAQVQTLDAWALQLARNVFQCKIRICPEAPGVVASLKRHPALFRALRERFKTLKPENTTYDRLRRRLTTLYTDREFLAGVVAAAGGELSGHAIEDTVAHTMLQLADDPMRALRGVDAERKQTIDGRKVWEGTPEALAGTVDLEDLPILLFLRAWHGRLAGRPLSHLVLDEAEDFSLFDLYVLGERLGETHSVTLAGDEAQQTASSFAGWPQTLSTIGASLASTVRLSTSYRCPRPVVELARHVLGHMAPARETVAAREGAPVGRFRFPTEAQAHLFVADAIHDLATREPRASVGVICRDDASARRIAERLPEARLVLDGAFTFEPGVDVTDVDNAKGLEWDYVVVPDATLQAYPVDDDARRHLHVAVTRTSHQLWLVAGGTPTPLLPLET